MSLETSKDQICPADEISAYLDGEISAEAEVALESHFANCPGCRVTLNQQKQFLIVIDGSLDRTIEPPPAFVTQIVANAESHVRGFRDRRQIIPAFVVIVVLCFLAVLLMPLSETGQAAGSIRDAIVHIPTLIRMAGGVVADVLFGVSVFIRPATLSAATYILIPIFLCIALATLFLSWKLKNAFVRNGTK